MTAVGVGMFNLAADAVETRSLVSVSFAELEGDAQAWAEQLESERSASAPTPRCRMSGAAVHDDELDGRGEGRRV